MMPLGYLVNTGNELMNIWYCISAGILAFLFVGFYLQHKLAGTTILAFKVSLYFNINSIYTANICFVLLYIIKILNSFTLI